jgi:hypothetical protein
VSRIWIWQFSHQKPQQEDSGGKIGVNFFKYSYPMTLSLRGNVVLVYAKEYYTAIKKSELLSFATKWMELESFVLHEISQGELTEGTKGREIKQKQEQVQSRLKSSRY